MSKYIPTIGLEVHVELKTKTKMFCNSANDPDAKEPNIHICPICVGHPGTLPTINKEAIDKLIKVGLALNCKIAEFSKFDRKSYFYPDLPKGYQISQYDLPICDGGYLEINSASHEATQDKVNLKKIHLERIHMEEDAGTLKHSDDKEYSYVDYNRAGIPLMELVTKPDMHSAEDVELFARELQLILRYLGASDANIEKGQMRVEVNISIAPTEHETHNTQYGTKDHSPSTPSSGVYSPLSIPLGTKVEIKNIGSINSAMRAAKYEIERQTKVLEEGNKVIQETRGWDDVNDKTFSQRSKEGSADYRYFPEPDLPPLRLIKEYVEGIRVRLPELPLARRGRFARLYGLTNDQTEMFTMSKGLGDYFEQVASELDAFDGVDTKPEHYIMAANYLISDGSGLSTKLKPNWFADVIIRLSRGELSSTNAKQLLQIIADEGDDPESLIKKHNLAQISDTSALEGMIEQVIEKNPDPVVQYKAGKTQALQFLVGKTMALSKGQADPQAVKRLLEMKLK